MLVKELIERLKEYNPDEEVYVTVNIPSDPWCKVTKITRVHRNGIIQLMVQLEEQEGE